MGVEFEHILKLLVELSELPSNAKVPDDLHTRLLDSARKVGAGALGVHGVERDEIRQALLDNPASSQTLLEFLNSHSPAVRSWAGAFIEQLFPEDEARSHLLSALQTEPDANTASWLSMYVARLCDRPPPKAVCTAIEQAHTRFKAEPDLRRQIARAWGYAGCPEALPALASDLNSGGHDQKDIAMDGMLALGSVDNAQALKALWKVFDSIKWQDLRRKAAYLLMHFSDSQSDASIKRMINILISTEHSELHREAAAEALANARLSQTLMKDNLETVLAGLVLNRGATAAHILKTLKRSIDDWPTHLAHYAVLSQDHHVLSALSHALASEPVARREAVKILKDYASGSDDTNKAMATAALKEIGGEEAFNSLEEILQSRYIKPSNDLQEASFQVFTDTIDRMRRNYEAGIRMNRVIFWLGIGVVVIGIGSALFGQDGGVIFGTAGVIAGLGTLVSQFLFGPLNRLQNALNELVQIEVAFVTFMHRLLQARSIFEQQYLSENIDLEVLSRFDELLENGMKQTVELLEKMEK